MSGDQHDPQAGSDTPTTRPADKAAFAVVGIGTSAGGLEACRKLLSGLPKMTGMAFIIVQHLEPHHESMMAELLAEYTDMPVHQATDGMLVEKDHLYIIPPGSDLAAHNGTLHLSAPAKGPGVRLPVDFMLHSLGKEYGSRAICVILTGSLSDGSLGLQAVKEAGGFVIVQDPADASYDGMPSNAVATGDADLVIGLAAIPAALMQRKAQMAQAPADRVKKDSAAERDVFLEIIALVRSITGHDFAPYKRGTLQRRIERRMGLVGLPADAMDRYQDLLRKDRAEVDLLVEDLLINVTMFFRDPKVFEYLSKTVIPDLIREKEADATVRLWVAGCSTGEEVYSFAILFREQIRALKSHVKLLIFASDLDVEAVEQARRGFYPATIATDVSGERLERFFTKVDGGYQVVSTLRESVVFTVQDLLVAPPFSRLDLVSCRNLLIYLGAEAQGRILSLFHFALRPGGILVLGSAEAANNAADHFEPIAKAERIYRHIGHGRSSEFAFSSHESDVARPVPRAAQQPAATRSKALEELCRKQILSLYAPAAVLITPDYECLFFMGPTERYLQVAHGYPSHDLIALTSAHLHTKLRAAVQRAGHDNTRALVKGARRAAKDTTTFSIAVEPVQHEGENLLLVCFIDEQNVAEATGHPATPADEQHLADIERELETTRAELQDAFRKIGIMSDEQKSFNEEALSVNEEQQSTNEELLISKEELQSLNEELTVLNSQLQETLERQRTTSNDLQNILYSTDMATLFLDTKFNIRFFTPATKSLFNLIASDIGRPLSDLQSLAADKGLTADARTVLQGLLPVEREIETLRGVWFTRRILPYRTQDNKVEGVIITFTDITERKSADKAIEAAKRQAELANIAKSRFLAAASHDLRQPLQTLSLLQGMLETSVEDERSQKLVARLDQTLGAMTGILNTLLDINQIEAGTVRAEFSDFPINELFERLRGEFAYHAQAKHLELRVVSCSLLLHSDPHLLEQMLRNLLTNALKYTKHGKVLLGVRRRAGKVAIEIWDSGIGIPASELDAIFNEYHQLDNAARERDKGLGLGLSIVQRLAKLLDHDVRVSSKLGKGSAFSIEIDVPAGQTETRLPKAITSPSATATKRARNARILIIEDDPEIRELLDLALSEEGHKVSTAPDGVVALDIMAREHLVPDLILADYNLPRGMNGVELTAEIRARLHRSVPVIILTGDISTKALADIAKHDCTQINKPVKLPEIKGAIDHLLSLPPPVKLPKVEKKAADPSLPTIHVVDDDEAICDALRGVLEEAGWAVNTYASAEAFLASYEQGHVACLLIDAYLPGLSGLELLKTLNERGHSLPSIMITGRSDVPMAVQAMQAGALNFIEKPVSRTELIASVGQALEQARDTVHTDEQREEAIKHVASLTPRQFEIMNMVLAGHPSKNIAADLGISQRTVENHRACIMKKMGAKSLPALARRAMAAIANSPSKV